MGKDRTILQQKITYYLISKRNNVPFIIYGFSMSTILSFKDVENKNDVYRGIDCMQKFCESLRDHAMKVIN